MLQLRNTCELDHNSAWSDHNGKIRLKYVGLFCSNTFWTSVCMPGYPLVIYIYLNDQMRVPNEIAEPMLQLRTTCELDQPSFLRHGSLSNVSIHGIRNSWFLFLLSDYEICSLHEAICGSACLQLETYIESCFYSQLYRWRSKHVERSCGSILHLLFLLECY